MKGHRLVQRQSQGLVFFGGVVSFLLVVCFTASLAFSQNPCTITNTSACGDIRWPGLTPTVPQPSFPSLCTTVVGSNGEPAGVLYALQYSGSLNKAALDTTRLQTAMNSCKPAQGQPAVGVELTLNPSSTSCSSAACNAFLSGSLTLPAGVTLIIDPDVTLYATSGSTALFQIGPNTGSTVTEYTGGAMGYWGIMGYGTIDGQGTGGQAKLISLGGGPSTSADYFTLYGITLQNPGQIHFIGNSNDLLVYDAKVTAPANTANTDGIDPAGSSNITIVNSFISDGDDQIAFNAGSAHVANVTIAHNHLYAGHGISIGSYTTEGMENMLVTDVAIDNNGNFGSASKNSLRIKSDSENGGEVKNILYNGVCIQNGGHILVFNPYYETSTGSHYPNFHDITLQNINVLNEDTTPHNGASALEGYDTGSNFNPLNNVTLDNVVFNYTLSQFENEFSATATIGSEYGIDNASFILGPDPVSFSSSVWDALNGLDGITVTDNTGGNSNPPYNCTGKFTYLAGELFAAGSSGAPLVSPLQVNAGSSVTLRAIVQPIVQSTHNSSTFKAPATSGTLTFYDNGTAIGTATVSGQRITNYTISNVSAGTHVYTATYSGDPNYTTASGSVPTNPTNATAPTFPSFTVQAAAAASVTPSVTALNKTYDGTTTEPLGNVTCTLTPSESNVTCAPAAAAFASVNVGTGITVTATGITLSGTAASSYTLSSTSATTTADITPATPVLTLSCTEVPYDGNPHSCTGSATGVGGIAVAGSFSFSPANETAAGSYPVTGTFTSADSNYASGGTASGTLTIDLASQAPSVSCPAPLTYDGNAHSCTITGGVGTCSSASVTNVPGSTTLALSCTGDSNHSPWSSTGAITINPATPVLTLTCASVTANGNPQACSPGGSATGVGGAAVTGTWTYTYNGSATVPSAAATYSVVGTFTSTNTNYASGGTATASFVIGPEPVVMVPLSCPTVTYDGTAHACTATPTPGTASCSGLVPETNAGSYPESVTCTNAGYVAGTATGTLVINAATPALSVTCTEVTFDGAAHSCTGTATGVGGATVSGTFSCVPGSETNAGSYPETCTFTSTNSNYASGGTASGTLKIDVASQSPSVSCPAPLTYDGNAHSCTITGGVGACSSASVTNVPGSTTLALSCAGDSNHSPWSSTGAITINPATPALTLTCLTVTPNGNPQACSPGGSATGIGGTTVAGSWTYTYNGSATVPSAGGTYTVVGTFTSSNPNYASGGTATGSFLILSPETAVNITLSCPTVTYDGTQHGCTATPTPATATCSGLVSETNAGSYSESVTCTKDGYLPGSATGTMVINPATPTLSVTCAGGVYNGTAYSCTGLATGVGGTTVAGSFAFSPGSETSAGSYPEMGTFTSINSNYVSGGTASGTLIINPAIPTVTVTCPTVTYDGSAHSCTATATGVGGAAVSGSFTFSPGSETAVGSYPEAATFSSSNPNYTNGSGSGTLVINAPPTGTPAATFSTMAVTFPSSIMIGQSSPAQYVTIMSAGTASLQVSGVTIGGANPGDFTVTNQAGTCTTGATLVYHADCNLRVVFTPTAVGTRSAIVYINDNLAGSPQQVTVSGTAISGAQLSLSATTLTFPATTVGTTAATQYVTLKSTGFQPAVINQVVLSSGDFDLSDQAGTCTTAATTSLVPGASCNIRVKFHPTATGARTATVVINDNTAASPHSVTLNGTGQ